MARNRHQIERAWGVSARASHDVPRRGSQLLRLLVAGSSVGALLISGPTVWAHGLAAKEPHRSLGPSSCSGVRVRPSADLQLKINSHPEGTTFCLKEGVHRLPIDGVHVKSHDRFIGEPGAVLDGEGIAEQGLWGYGSSSGQKGVVVRGLVIQGVDGRAIKTGRNWRVLNNELRDSEIGIAVLSGSVMRGNHIHHNSRYGIVGGPTTDVLIEDNELSFNNTSNFCDGTCGGDAGGSKIVGTSDEAGTNGVVWRGNWVHDNTGPGIWSDGNVHDVLYENNLVEGNSGPGIFHEISWDATIRNNVVRDNGTEAIDESCWWGSQIHVNNSQNVEIYRNRVSSPAGANGICLVDSTRDNEEPFPTHLANIHVHHNTIRLSASAMTGLVGNAANRIRFDWNRYYVPDRSGKYWAWEDLYPLTWRQFKARAGEENGSRRLDP